MPESVSLTVLLPDSGESWPAFLGRLKKTEGEVLLLIAGRDEELTERADVRASIITACKPISSRVRLATKHPLLANDAKAKGIRVVDRTKDIAHLLHGHPRYEEVLRVFSPHQWKQQLKSQLQRMGLLSVPKIRIYALVGLSAFLFFIVVFRLLPSAEIRVWPRRESMIQTVNIYLAQSGALLESQSRIRNMPLIPITITYDKTIVSDHVSKEFNGKTAEMTLAIFNTTKEDYSLRGGTRFSNEAGMVFRIVGPVTVPAGSQKQAKALADDVDLYGQIIGDRGNVPAGLTWKIPGLPEDVRAKVYAKNPKAATGGTTAYLTVLKQEDLDLARKRLEQELLTGARSLVDQQQDAYNREHPDQELVLLNPKRYPELTLMTYSDMSLPDKSLGHTVPSITARGVIHYTVFAYDAQAILAFLQDELRAHVREGRQLIDESLGLSRLVSHVIDYADDLSWIKLTVDLTGTEQYVLDPLSPQGALFAKRVRERTAGLSNEDAQRIVANMPEVEKVEISHWPPWNGSLPPLPSNISVVAQ